jgi:hypothetical protein
MIGLTPVDEIALLSYHQLYHLLRGTTHLIVVRVIDQTMLSVNQDPVESTRVNDALGQWSGRVAIL